MIKEIKYGTPSQGLSAATLAFFAGLATIALLADTISLFTSKMVMTPMMIAMLVAIPNLTGTLIRIPFSAITDSSGGKKVILISLICSTIGMFGLYFLVLLHYPNGITRNIYPLFLSFAALMGVGGAVFSPGITQTSYWFPQKKQGGALGIFGGIGNLSPGIASFLLPVMLIYIGLVNTFLAFSIFMLICTFAYFIIGKDAWYFQLLKQGKSKEEAIDVAQKFGQRIFPKGSAIKSLIISGLNWKTWAIVFIYFNTFGGFLALVVWLPVYWMKFHSMDLNTAVIITAIYSIITSLLRIFGGKLSDWLGGEKTTVFALIIMLFGSTMMLTYYSKTLDIIALIILGIGMGIGNASIFKLVPQEIPDAVGGASGWIGGIGGLGGFILPLVMAMFVDDKTSSTGYATGFSVFVILTVLSFIGIFLLNKYSLKKKLIA